MGRCVPAFAAVFALMSLLAASPALPGSEGADRHYAAGRGHLSAGKTAEAAAAFEKALVEDPDHVESRYQLSLILMTNVVTYGKAEDTLLELPGTAMRAGGKTRDDVLFRAGLALGKLYVKSGRHAQAVRLVRNVIASAPPNAPVDDAHNTLGLALYYERLYEDAIFELRKAIKLNPNNVEAKFNLKTIRARLEHYHAGKIYSRLGDRKEAIAQYRTAIGLDPRFVEARHRLGVELLASGDAAEALRELRRADAISSGYRKAYEIWYAEGLAHNALGHRDDAMRMFLKTIEARANFAPAFNEAGKIHVARGEFNEAIVRFVAAIRIDPKTEYVRNLQASFQKQGQ